MLIGVGEHAFLWEGNGPMVDLNTLIPVGASLQLTYAIAINDRGEIAGFGVPPGVLPEDYETQGHAFVLLPCDENHPRLKGCDYSMADADAQATRTATHNEPSRSVPSSTWRDNHRLIRNQVFNRHSQGQE